MRLEQSDALIGGRPWLQAASEARAEFLAVARAYHASFGQQVPSPRDAGAPWIASGHQPELFHAGVWAKNLAVARLADHWRGIAAHVLIDNDTLKRSAIAVPAGRPDSPLVAYVPFDRWEEEIPFEERCVLEEEVFSRFPEEVAERMRTYPFEPILGPYWESVRRYASVTPNVGERIAAGRRDLEARWGLAAWEAPLSRLADGASFRRLAAEICLAAEAFARQHNQALDEFKRRNKVRSDNHPVPALESRDGAVEIPFWTWSAANPARRRVFVRREGNSITLLAAGNVIAAVAAGANIEDFAHALGKVLGCNKLRPRALLTTIFLRLLLCDLFLHGVGGAKYDELTDAIVRRFWRLEPPAFAVLSATILLPGAARNADTAALAALARRDRDLIWNPDRYLDERLREQDPVASWIERKFELFGDEPAGRAERRRRFEEFRALNGELAHYLGTLPGETKRQLAAARNQLESRHALASREFAYCLHSAESLRRLWTHWDASPRPEKT